MDPERRPMRELSDIRQEIDGIDREILQLFQRRIDLATQVAEYKLATGKPVLDAAREEDKLKALTTAVCEAIKKMGVRELFRQIMAISRKWQYRLLTNLGLTEKNEFQVVEELETTNARVVYQGVEGAYSQEAMETFFGKPHASFPVETWRDAFLALEKGEADFAVLPIENSSAGFVSEIDDLLVEYQKYIVGEQLIPIQHALLGLPGTSLEDITCVYSHPQALMQCVDFLDEHRRWDRISLKNTAVSAKKVLEEGNPHQAAIANPRTAALYHHQILQEHINYSKENATRFLIVSAKPICRKDAKKVSICFEIPHEKGALHRILSHIVFNDLDMNKIESRPVKDKSFAYRFFVDIEGNLSDAAVQNAITGLREEALGFRILGNY